MADIYVRSTDGSNSDNGSTWPLAKATLAGADAIDASGDRIIMSHVHAESTASSVSYLWAGSLASPTKIVCGNDGAQPPTSPASSATVTVTGNSNISFNGNCDVSGVIFTTGDGAGGGSFNGCNVSGNHQRFINCSFRIPNTLGASGIFPTMGSGSLISVAEWLNCTVKFAFASQGIGNLQGTFRWNGGSAVSGTTSPTLLIASLTSTCDVLIENVDLSNCAAGITLTVTPTRKDQKIVFRNMKMPSTWSGNLIGSSFSGEGRVEAYNVDSGSTNYRIWIEDYRGTIRDETTNVRSGGASDGTTSLAWKMASSANASYPLLPLTSPEIVIWNSTTGAPVTVTVQILRDSATNLKDNEIWLELNYLDDASSPLGALIADSTADAFTSAADQATSAETWTTTGMTNPNTQKLSVTFTPQKKGFFAARVKLAKASTTVYIDPVLIVS